MENAGQGDISEQISVPVVSIYKDPIETSPPTILIRRVVP